MLPLRHSGCIERHFWAGQSSLMKYVFARSRHADAFASGGRVGTKLEKPGKGVAPTQPALSLSGVITTMCYAATSPTWCCCCCCLVLSASLVALSLQLWQDGDCAPPGKAS
jgi:hypothetical protein